MLRGRHLNPQLLKGKKRMQERLLMRYETR